MHCVIHCSNRTLIRCARILRAFKGICKLSASSWRSVESRRPHPFMVNGLICTHPPSLAHLWAGYASFSTPLRERQMKKGSTKFSPQVLGMSISSGICLTDSKCGRSDRDYSFHCSLSHTVRRACSGFVRLHGVAAPLFRFVAYLRRSVWRPV